MAQCTQGVGLVGTDPERGPHQARFVHELVHLEPTPGREPARRHPESEREGRPSQEASGLTEDELARLLDAARRRPLRDALAVRRGPRKGVGTSDILPGTRARLELLGRERALNYKTLVLTGLRKAELASLTVAQVHLDTPRPCFELDAKDEKSREGNSIPLRDDLAADLRLWLADLLTALQGGASRRGASIPTRLPGDMKPFDVPPTLIRIIDRDLKAAGIPKSRRAGPHPRCACTQDDVLHPALQGRGAAPDRAGVHASQQPFPHGGRLYGHETPRRAWSPERTARPTLGRIRNPCPPARCPGCCTDARQRGATDGERWQSLG